MSRCHRRSRTTVSPDFQMPHQLCHRLSWLHSNDTDSTPILRRGPNQVFWDWPKCYLPSQASLEFQNKAMNVNCQMIKSHFSNLSLKFGLELFLETFRRWEQSKLRSSAQKTIWSKVVLLTPKIRIIVGFLTEISLVFNERRTND